MKRKRTSNGKFAKDSQYFKERLVAPTMLVLTTAFTWGVSLSPDIYAKYFEVDSVQANAGQTQMLHEAESTPTQELLVEPTPIPTPEPFNKCLNGDFSPRLIQHIESKPHIWLKIKKRFPKEPRCAGELIARESGFNEFAINPTSGACGLVQSLPCTKLVNKCALEDVDCQLDWLDEYVSNRYGSFKKAIEFHDKMNWY